jgi:hypothetical protein
MSDEGDALICKRPMAATQPSRWERFFLLHFDMQVGAGRRTTIVLERPSRRQRGLAIRFLGREFTFGCF